VSFIERLKSFLRGDGRSDHRARDEEPVVPLGPATSQAPPVIPLDQSVEEARDLDDERS
jgi:hypothetical protein